MSGAGERWRYEHDPDDSWHKYRIYEGDRLVANILGRGDAGRDDAETIVVAVNAILSDDVAATNLAYLDEKAENATLSDRLAASEARVRELEGAVNQVNAALSSYRIHGESNADAIRRAIDGGGRANDGVERLRAVLENILQQTDGPLKGKVPTRGLDASWYFQMIEHICNAALRGAEGNDTAERP